MCSYCHEFIKRNQSMCGYCGKVLSKSEEPIVVGVQEKKKKVYRIVIPLEILIAFGFSLIMFWIFRPLPPVLETVEISEPANIELVELIPYEPWVH